MVGALPTFIAVLGSACLAAGGMVAGLSGGGHSGGTIHAWQLTHWRTTAAGHGFGGCSVLVVVIGWFFSWFVVSSGVVWLFAGLVG